MAPGMQQRASPSQLSFNVKVTRGISSYTSFYVWFPFFLRNFEQKNLGQIKTVYPTALTFRQEKNLIVMGKKDAGYQLTIDADLSDVTGQLHCEFFSFYTILGKIILAVNDTLPSD